MHQCKRCNLQVYINLFLKTQIIYKHNKSKSDKIFAILQTKTKFHDNPGLEISNTIPMVFFDSSGPVRTLELGGFVLGIESDSALP